MPLIPANYYSDRLLELAAEARAGMHLELAEALDAIAELVRKNRPAALARLASLREHDHA